MARRRKTTTKPKPQEPQEPTGVRVVRGGRVRIEGNRTVGLMRGDIFRHHMARVLWHEAREYVERWEPERGDTAG